MRAALPAALLVAAGATGCRIDLDRREEVRLCEPSDRIPVCLEAEGHADFEWIQANIFSTNCSGDVCHSPGDNGEPPSGKLDLSAGRAYETLLGSDGLGVMSAHDEEHKLVEPGNPNASYLVYIMKGVLADADEPAFTPPPDSVGFMPMSNNTLCCQKIDAIIRWIEAGALPPAM